MWKVLTLMAPEGAEGSSGGGGGLLGDVGSAGSAGGAPAPGTQPGAGSGGGTTPAAAGGGDASGGEGAPGWFLHEGVAGQGDAPTWFLKDKYKTVAEQARAYTEATKRLGSFTGPPQGDYDLKLPKDLVDAGVVVNPEDPMAQDAAKLCRELGMNQDGFSKLIGLYARTEAGRKKAQEAAELQALGNDGTRLIGDIKQFAAANMDEQTVGMLQKAVNSADGVRLVHWFIGKVLQAGNIATDVRAQQSDTMSKEKLDSLVSDPRYWNDEAYRKDVERRIEAWQGKRGVVETPNA